VTTQAPLSYAVYRCRSCGGTTSEPFAMPEAELRAALDADEVPIGRFHRECPLVMGVEWVVSTGTTLAGALASTPEARMLARVTADPVALKRDMARAQAALERRRTGKPRPPREPEPADPRQVGLFGEGDR
jgi:hypothetical protein